MREEPVSTQLTTSPCMCRYCTETHVSAHDVSANRNFADRGEDGKEKLLQILGALIVSRHRAKAADGSGLGAAVTSTDEAGDINVVRPRPPPRWLPAVAQISLAAGAPPLAF